MNNEDPSFQLELKLSNVASLVTRFNNPRSINSLTKLLSKKYFVGGRGSSTWVCKSTSLHWKEFFLKGSEVVSGRNLFD